jgi:hypothetical protein
MPSAPIDPPILDCTADANIRFDDVRSFLVELGSASDLPSIRPMQGQQKTLIGVFAVSFVSADLVRVTLRGEECARTVGSPRRRTRQIALLRPWEPVRVLLNGRFGGFSGQHYFLREYHLALCSGPVPERVEAPRLVDLQADLF